MSFMTKRSNTSLRLEKSFADAFDVVLHASQLAGEVTEKNLRVGYIVVKTPLSLVPYRNPATVRVSLKKLNDSQTDVEFASESFDGLIGSGAAGAAIDKIIRELERILR